MNDIEVMIVLYHSRYLLPSLLLLGAKLAFGNHALKVDQSVMDTPANEYIYSIRKELSLSKYKPSSLEDAARKIIDSAQGLLRQDLSMAAKNSAKVACNPILEDLSSQSKSTVFSEVFWREFKKGEVRDLIERNSTPSVTATLFAGFYEAYLNEYAIAWGMRYSKSDLFGGCKAYGVDDVTSCLKALLVFGASQTTSCRFSLEDEMLQYVERSAPSGKQPSEHE